MQIIQTKITEIRPYEKNPRKNDKAVDTVANSISQYGFQQPIVVDKQGVIVVGHTRYRAAKKLNLQTVPVVFATDLTDEQVRGYRIMDNRSNQNSAWDDSLLVEELTALIENSNLQDLSYDTGFTESELNKLFKQQEPDLEKYLKNEHYKSKQGDLWILGSHKLLNGDSTKQEELAALLTNEKIDCLWEDPPYGVAYETANGINYTKEENLLRNHKIANDNLTPEQLELFLESHLAAVNSYVKKGAIIYWCHDIKFTQQFRDLLEDKNYHVSDTLIWKKNNASTWLSDYAKYYEPILYGWKQGAEHAWYGKGMMPNTISVQTLDELSKEELIALIENIDTNYQEFKKESRKVASLHPTVKPVRLIMHHLFNSTKINDIVYDGFAGSGSTLIACEKTQRQARCIEYEPKFVDIIIKRWQDETGLQAVRSDGILWDDVEATTLPEQVEQNLTLLFNMENASGTNS